MRNETPPSSADAAGATSYNPEMLIVAMEHVMVLFDRSTCIPYLLAILYLSELYYCFSPE